MIQSPLSFTGSAARIWRVTDRDGAMRWVAIVVAVVAIAVAWVVVLAWTLFWGIFLIPWRLIRRGSRKRKLERRRHRELLGDS
ncbi:MAG: hypothetical protein ACOCT8_03175 [Actinomycetota bacterium]